VLYPGRRAGLFALSATARLVAIAVGAGLLVAAVLVPVIGAAGVAVRDAANTFNTMSVPALGAVPIRSEILDADGNLIAYYYPDDIYRIPVTYDQIAPVMRNAIVAIEDSRFWLHGAFDLRGTVRALANDLSGGNTQGGSTLAQQYVKNALILTATTKAQQEAAAADTTSRKVRELRIAADVEHQLTKQQLLAAYLNVAFFNNNAYGIQVAAERYFSTSAAQLTLPQAAMLAGLVENPSAFDPLTDAPDTIARRNVVLSRMAQLGYITNAVAAATEKQPLGLNPSTIPVEQGCANSAASDEVFYCNYVLTVMQKDPAYAKAYQALNTTGGLKIYTTLDPVDQNAAQNAVDWVEPSNDGTFNPGGNVDTEVMVQPGAGYIRAIAVNFPYGSGPGETNIDYAVPTQYGGGEGVQTGSSSKLFTLVTALNQGIPFGFSQNIVSPSTIGGYSDCAGQSLQPYTVQNAEGSDKGTFTLYTGTTQSINVFFAHLEQKVGLCNVVKTAMSMGLTFANGVSLLDRDPAINEPTPADSITSFTLGAVNVTPLQMADAYATVASRGVYCSPIAISQILSSSGAQLPVESAGCHQVLSTDVADAANYILQGVLTAPGATADGRGISVPAAGKTGTANGGYYAAFAGYTPRLVGYVSVFNPNNPTTSGAMTGSNACYREDPAFGGGLSCPSQMFGDNAPAATWQMSFNNADLGSPPAQFVAVPANSPFMSMGNGFSAPTPSSTPCIPILFGPGANTCPGGGGGGGRGGGGGGGGPGGGGPPTA
jgi:membrane peptidoglycan carboxypeptidase